MTALEYLQNKIKENKVDIKNVKIEKSVSKYKKEINDLEKQSNMENPNHVFTYNNAFLGFTRVDKDDENNYFISNFAIMKKYRGKGLGKEIFGKIIDFIKKSFRPNSIQLWVYFDNDPARSIYYSYGFKPIETVFTGDLNHNKNNEAEIKSPDKEQLDKIVSLYKDYPDLSDTLDISKGNTLILSKDKDIAGCLYNTRKEPDGSYLTIFYPVATSDGILKSFLDNLVNNSSFQKQNKFDVLSTNKYKLFNTINKYGKPKQERLILK